MRILFSGCTALQVRPPTERRTTVSKIDVPASIVRALVAAGHEVDWRIIVPGEQLEGRYDLVWLNLAPMRSLNGRYGALGTLYALACKVPVVTFFDDWQFAGVFTNARSLRKQENFHRLVLAPVTSDGKTSGFYSRAEALASSLAATGKDEVGPFFLFVDPEGEHDMPDVYNAGLDRLLAFDRLRPVCPMYGWGNRHLVQKRMPAGALPLIHIDPSSTIVDILVQAPAHVPHAERTPHWLLAALMPHVEWAEKLKLEWPVRYLGARKSIRERGGERVETEVDVLAQYAAAPAALSPPYPHAGSGWWRSRFLYGAMTGTVLACAKNEATCVSPTYGLAPKAIERMTPAERDVVATRQRDALRAYWTSDDEFQAQVMAAVEEAMNRG